MAKESGNRQYHLRQLIAQQAARMMAEEGISDYAHAKRKAGRQLGVPDANCFPSNAEIEEEIRLHHQIYHQEDQPVNLRQLRQDALVVMRLLEKFNPHLTGPVLDGTAGRYAETDIQLFADSLKDVEIFLLNNQIPYSMQEKSYRIANDKRNQEKSGERKKVPVFVLEGPNGVIKLSVFTPDDMRISIKNPANGGNTARANAESLQALLDTTGDAL
ncbi:MAG TPA: hypothetical protein VFS17_04830 [Methylophilaceae bacterium]|nr:hypothetical protein [Methylophilaceae bacterium]